MPDSFMIEDRRLPVGKVPEPLMTRLLALPRKTNSRVLLGPGLGEDAAVVQMEAGPMVITSDPITFKTPKPGLYAIHINANDVAVMGAAPQFFTLTLIMPSGTTERKIEAVFTEAVEAGQAIDAVLIGGHSEISEAVVTPVISVTMFGELVAGRPLSTGDGRTGDAIIQVNPMAVEGTSILAAEHHEELAGLLGLDLVERAVKFLETPGLSVLAPANLAAKRLDVHAMHDPTEGGLATGLREIALASGKGLVILEEKLLIADETRKICECLGYDPLGLISSGCLVFTVADDRAAQAVGLMVEAGYDAAEIGRLVEDPGMMVIENRSGAVKDLPDFAVDELARE